MALAKPHTERARMKIEIFDQTYNVNADGNEEYLTELAAYVDKKMRTISESTQIVDSVKVAVLRQRAQKLEGPLRQRMEKCVSMVEKALEQAN
jgi:cell division protein ZapA (FtsZ GTPase activity inhibitor)